MAVSGVVNPYNYNTAYTRNRNVKGKATNQSTNAVATTPTNITLHIGSEDDPDGKAIGLLGFPDGSSTSVFKGQNYTTDHPVFTVKTWDADGNMTETEIDASKVDPGNASLQEMMALNANRQLNGEEDFGDQLMMSAGRIHGDEVSGSYDDFLSKNNWMEEIRDFMDMQYQLGNMTGYMNYKKAYDILQAISDSRTADDSTTETKSTTEEYSKALAEYAQLVKNKIENGETETSYQIGGQSFTEKEWEELISKIDESIDTIKEEIQAEAEQAKEKADQTKETQVQELLKDTNERSFELYGPNAPNEVKQAWMDAARETGVNGLGMQSNGMMGHITQLDVQRAIKWNNGEDTDVLGTTVESARQAVEKALYDLENPLESNTNRSASVQKSIEKEKEFYKVFLENLTNRDSFD